MCSDYESHVETTSKKDKDIRETQIIVKLKIYLSLLLGFRYHPWYGPLTSPGAHAIRASFLDAFPVLDQESC